MRGKCVQNFVFYFAIFLATFSPAFSQKQDSIDIPELLREAKQKSDDNWRRVVAEYRNYTYKWLIVRRKADKNGQIKEESELYELFFPVKCRVKNCRKATVLLAENGEPISAEKIGKQRIKAGEKLERMENDAKALELLPNLYIQPQWMRFGYYIRHPFSAEQKLIVSIDGQEILEKCEFFAPTREIINGRETIALNFRPRADAIFNEETKYMPQTEGKIWIDAADKVFIRLAIWQKGTKFSETSSDYLFENAALARDMTLTKEGIWFPHLGRINGLKHANLFIDKINDFSLENFDHHFFKTEVKAVEIKNPVEKKQ